jgi:CheY-like chemotaxis protein/predicted Ser/Thr protein kinase
MQIVLVLDSQPLANVHKTLGDMDCLLLAVNDTAKARFVLLNFPVDVWVCDLAVPGLDFLALRADAQARNSRASILLTGSALAQNAATALVAERQAAGFVAKPWQPLVIRNAIVELLHRERVAAAAAPPPAAGSNARRRLPFRGMGRRRPSWRPEAQLPGNDARYRLDELLGEGGVGRVYRAFDMLLDMEVAVKLLNPELSRDEEAIQSLKRETRICLQLNHKHIVRLFNLDKRNDLFLIVMEYVRGCTLSQMMARHGTLPPLMAAQIVAVMTDALSYAHRHGVLHKDLTPGNVLISDDGVLKLIDFGIADMINRQCSNEEFVIGTPAYMSPEQLRGEPLDARTDVYSLGVLTYQIMTGMLPSRPDATVEDMACREHPPLAGLPYPVLQVLELATAFDPARRWPGVSHFGTAFAAACAREYDVCPEEA